MVGDFLQHQRNNPVPNPVSTSSRSKMLIGIPELDWRGENGEAYVVVIEKRFKLQIYIHINTNRCCIILAWI